MNLKKILVALPVVGAMVFTTGVASGQITGVRVEPTKVSSTTTPGRDRTRPYDFTTVGRVSLPAVLPLVCPPGTTDANYCRRATPAEVCHGRVVVTYQKQKTTISSRTAYLRPDCTYASKVRFRTRLLTRIGRLTVRSVFQGNESLAPRTSSSHTVRAG